MGAVGLVVGALWPWSTLALGDHTALNFGYEGTGIVTAAIGLLLLLDAILRKPRPGRMYSPFSALLSLFAAAIACLHGLLIVMMEPIDPTVQLPHLGSGQLITVIAAALVFFGGLAIDPKEV